MSIAGVRPMPSWMAILLCAGGVALFSIMDAAMKYAALAAGAFSVLVWRSLFASLIMGTAMVATHNRWPPPNVLRLHLVRGALICVMAWLFFWGLTLLPLAEAIALSFIAPIIALWLSAVMLGEKVSGHSIAAGIFGLVGVGVIISGRLSGEYDRDALVGAIAVLVSAVLFAVNLVLQRQQAQVAEPIEITFFQNAIILALLTPLAPWLFEPVVLSYWPYVVIAALLACGSQLLLARAYSAAPASRLIPIEYSAFIWASLLGWLIFAEPLTWAVALGAILIVIACILGGRDRPTLAAHVEADVA